MCLFAGGLKISDQAFGVSKLEFIPRNCPFRNLLLGATQNTTLLKISVIAVLLPTAFHISVADRPLAGSQEAHDALVAVILLFSKLSVLSPCFLLKYSVKFMRVTLLSNCTRMPLCTQTKAYTLTRLRTTLCLNPTFSAVSTGATGTSLRNRGI